MGVQVWAKQLDSYQLNPFLLPSNSVLALMLPFFTLLLLHWLTDHVGEKCQINEDKFQF
jgi:hypothetical protein